MTGKYPRDPKTGRNFDGRYDEEADCGCIDYYHGSEGLATRGLCSEHGKPLAVIAEIPKPASATPPNGAPPTASDGSQAIGSASQRTRFLVPCRVSGCGCVATHGLVCQTHAITQVSDARFTPMEPGMTIGSAEERDDNMLWAELKVAQADNAELTSSLTALRGTLTDLIEMWRERANHRGGDDREFYTGVGERLCANDLTTALAVSRVPTDG